MTDSIITANVRPPANTYHWFFDETEWCYRKFLWDGTHWIVPGFKEPQKPEDMVEEWVYYYVAPANEADTNIGQDVADTFYKLYRAGRVE